MLLERQNLSCHFLLELPSSRLLGNLDAHLDDELADLRFLERFDEIAAARRKELSPAISPFFLPNRFSKRRRSQNRLCFVRHACSPPSHFRIDSLYFGFRPGADDRT